MWVEKFELLDGLYSALDTRDCSKCNLTKGNTDNPAIRIYTNKIENRITFKKCPGYYLKLLKPETLKLHESNKSKITKGEIGENVLT